jgi:hypothetical protein
LPLGQAKARDLLDLFVGKRIEIYRLARFGFPHSDELLLLRARLLDSRARL